MIKKNLFAASLLAMLCLGNASAMIDGDAAETPPQPPAKQTNASAMNDGDAAETPPPPAKQTTADDEILHQAIDNVDINVLLVGKKGVGKTAIAARIYHGLLSDRGHVCISEREMSKDIGRVPLNQAQLDTLINATNKMFGGEPEIPVTYAPPADLDYQKDWRYHFHIKEADVNDPNINELYKQASVIFPVFDINDESFTVEEAMKWYDDIRKAAGEENTDYVSSYIHFVGNKFDIFKKNFQGELYDQYNAPLFPQFEIFRVAGGKSIKGRNRCVEGSGYQLSCLAGDFVCFETVLSVWGQDHRKIPTQAGWKECSTANFQVLAPMIPAEENQQEQSREETTAVQPQKRWWGISPQKTTCGCGIA